MAISEPVTCNRCGRAIATYWYTTRTGWVCAPCAEADPFFELIDLAEQASRLLGESNLQGHQ